jgi:7-cyano-7-deazaguanine synthase
MTEALVVLSGGQDSCTCLFWAKEEFDEVHAITFDYNQRHAREIQSAVTIATMAKVRSHEVIAIGPILQGSSPLVNPTQQLEQYKDFESMDKIIGDRMELTFVPMRNTLFLTIAANSAYCKGIKNIVTGVCQADNANYADCREEFIDAMEVTINWSLGSRREYFIQTPLMNNSKSETVKMALEIPGCWEALAYSHTAYDGAYPPVGHDHATILRAHGFEEAGYPDPLILRAWFEGAMPLPLTHNYDHIRTKGPYPSLEQLLETGKIFSKV